MIERPPALESLDSLKGMDLDILDEAKGFKDKIEAGLDALQGAAEVKEMIDKLRGEG